MIVPATPYRFYLLGLNNQSKMTITKLETVSEFNDFMWVNESTLAHDIIAEQSVIFYVTHVSNLFCPLFKSDLIRLFDYGKY